MIIRIPIDFLLIAVTIYISIVKLAITHFSDDSAQIFDFVCNSIFLNSLFPAEENGLAYEHF